MRGFETSATNPASRRAALASLDDAGMADALVRLAGAHRTFDAAQLAQAAALPLGEVVASPFALRAVAMGVEAGATSRHRELRALIDWTASIDPAVRDPDHDVWDRGVLKTGKYQAFTTEAPFAIFDPAYVSKWGPHEMLHRAAGYFFRRGMTRWELYLGARLNELVPVVTFYGPEQVMRLDENEFDRKAAGASPRASIEEARWRTDDEASQLERARRSVPILREGLSHFERELTAIDEELVSGRRVRAAHPFLDASSDATAYVVGHYERLSQVAVGQVLERRAVDDVAVYRDRIEALFDRLLFGELSGTLDESARRDREVVDLLLRAAHLGAGVEADLAPLLEASDPEEVRRRLPAQVGDEEAALVLADGADGWRSTDRLDEGLRQVMPVTSALVPELVTRFARSTEIVERGGLVQRAMRFVEAHEEAAVVDLARLEAALVCASRDDGVERLCVPPDSLPADLAGGSVIVSATLDRIELSHDALGAHSSFVHGGAAMWPEAGAQTLLIVGFEDAVSVVPVSAELADALESRVVELDEETIRDLAAAGVIGWRPGKGQ